MGTNLSVKVQTVMNEPGCSHNQGKSDSERKKGCSAQLRPGAAAGGCAFDGAKIALQTRHGRGTPRSWPDCLRRKFLG